MIRQQRGQMLPAALLLVLLSMALAAVVTDGLALLEMRQRGYRLAAAAALQGTRGGVDYATYIGSGEIWLDEQLAHAAAQTRVETALLAQGVSDYHLQVRVLPRPTGGTIPNFPPHAAAQQGGGVDWQAAAPSVGVYLELPVTTVWLGTLLGTGPVYYVHVFAAASVALP